MLTIVLTIVNSTIVISGRGGLCEAERRRPGGGDLPQQAARREAHEVQGVRRGRGWTQVRKILRLPRDMKSVSIHKIILSLSNYIFINICELRICRPNSTFYGNNLNSFLHFQRPPPSSISSLSPIRITETLLLLQPAAAEGEGGPGGGASAGVPPGGGGDSQRPLQPR